jgi:hypothetical protein
MLSFSYHNHKARARQFTMAWLIISYYLVSTLLIQSCHSFRPLCISCSRVGSTVTANTVATESNIHWSSAPHLTSQHRRIATLSPLFASSMTDSDPPQRPSTSSSSNSSSSSSTRRRLQHLVESILGYRSMMRARMAMVQRKLWHVLGVVTLTLALWQGPLLLYQQPPMAHAADGGTTAVVQKSEPTTIKLVMKQPKKKKKSGILSTVLVGGALVSFAGLQTSPKKKSETTTTDSGNDDSTTTTLDPTAVTTHTTTTTTTTVAETEEAAASWSSTELTLALETATILPPVAPLPEVKLVEETASLDATIADGEVESETDTIIVDDDDMAMGQGEENKIEEPVLVSEEEPVAPPSKTIVEEPVEVTSTEETISGTHQDETVEEKDEHLPPVEDIVVGTYRYLGC